MPNNDGIYFWDTEDLEWKNLGNVMGVKGDKGDTGNTPNITATGSVTEDGGNPSVTVTKTGTVDNPNLEFNFKNFKGEKGDPGRDSTVPGPAGADGQPGITPNVTATASVSATTGTPDVTVTKTGTTENPVLNFAFSGLKGERGQQGVAGRDSTVPGPAGRDGVDGTDGVTPTITARATVDNTSSTHPTVSVVKTGTDANPDFEFNFHGLRGLTGNTGSRGPQGVAGPAGRNGNKIFSGGYLITETSGGMGTVVVDSTMANDMNVGDFFITTTTQGLGGTVLSKNGTTITLQKIVSIKGSKGDPGERGSTGSTGPAGPTPNITATATYINTSSDPDVTVRKTAIEGGSNFGFTFYNLKGQKGATGPAGPGVAFGGTTGQFLIKNSSTNYDTKWVTRHTVPTGGSMGYILTKNSSTDGDYSWKSPGLNTDYIEVLDWDAISDLTIPTGRSVIGVDVFIRYRSNPPGYSMILNQWIPLSSGPMRNSIYTYTWYQAGNKIILKPRCVYSTDFIIIGPTPEGYDFYWNHGLISKHEYGSETYLVYPLDIRVIYHYTGG